jgi:hypothetical protein
MFLDLRPPLYFWPILVLVWCMPHHEVLHVPYHILLRLFWKNNHRLDNGLSLFGLLLLLQLYLLRDSVFLGALFDSETIDVMRRSEGAQKFRGSEITRRTS